MFTFALLAQPLQAASVPEPVMTEIQSPIVKVQSNSDVDLIPSRIASGIHFADSTTVYKPANNVVIDPQGE